MRFSFGSVVASTLLLTTFVTAKIHGFIGPSQPITQGVPFNVTFLTENFILNNQQYYALFGLTTRSDIGDSIGSVPVAGVDISDYTTKVIRNFTISITIETIYSNAAQQTLATAVFGEIGASGYITVQYLNATVKVMSPRP